MEKLEPVEIYVDGLEGILLGQPVSKLRFTSTDSRSTAEVPQNNPRLTLTIPTIVLIQICQQMLNTMNTNQANLSDSATTYANTIKTLLGGSPTPKSTKTEG